MDYAWRNLRFELPAGLDDETVLTFVSRKDGAVDLNVTVSRDRLPDKHKGKLELYLVDAVDALPRQLSGYKLVDKQARKIGGRDGFVLEHSTTSRDGATLRMLQAYVLGYGADDELLIVTGTAGEADLPRLRKLFDGVVGSLKPRA